MAEHEYEWRVTMWNDTKSGPFFHAVIAWLVKSFPLCRDSGLHIITGEEYEKMVAEGKIAPATVECLKIKPGKEGAISRSYFTKYSSTWEKVSCAYTDFFAGWQARGDLK